MLTHTRAYWAPKSGSTDAEYQDALAYDKSNDGYCKASSQRFAVSDGASEAIYSGLWAKLLADAWLEGDLNLRGDFEPQIAALSKRWSDLLPNASLPWWAEEKIRNGSFATLSGLCLTHGEGGYSWEFQSVGDSCLFVLQDEGLAFAGPLDKSRQFENSPYLIGSNSGLNGALRDHIQFERRPFGKPLPKNTEFLLMTDALACWFLKQVERGVAASQVLGELEHEMHEQAFSDLVLRHREAGELRNDDVTLLSIIVWHDNDMANATRLR